MKSKDIRFKVTIGIGLVFVFSIIPLLLVARYNHGWADDYSYGYLAYSAWKQTHSIWQIILAAAAQVKNSYFNWQGTYSGIFFMAIQPGIFGDAYYTVTTYLLLFLLISSVLFFFKVIIIELLDGDKCDWFAISILILFLMIQCVPDPVQAFYWFNGSLYYLGFFSLLLYMIGICVQISCQEERKKIVRIRRVVMTVVLSAIIGGGNYVGTLLAVEISALILVIIYYKRLKSGRILAVPFVVLMVGFCISMMAPGNAIRSAAFTGQQKGVVQSIYYSFRYGVQFINEWTNLYLIFALMFLCPFLWNVVKKKNGVERYCHFPLLFLMFSFCLFASSFTPTLYATGGLGQNIEAAGRVQNVRYILFVLLIVFNVLYFMGWIKGRLADVRLNILTLQDMKMYYGFLVIGTIGLAICPKSFNELTSVSAIYSYYTGELQEYVQEAADRKALLESNESVVTLKPYKARPRLLYYYNDIQLDEHDWKNEIIARWYGKETVYLEDEAGEQ